MADISVPGGLLGATGSWEITGSTTGTLKMKEIACLILVESYSLCNSIKVWFQHKNTIKVNTYSEGSSRGGKGSGLILIGGGFFPLVFPVLIFVDISCD